MNEDGPTPPGWYPDPNGDGFRWYDGAEWTEYVGAQPPASPRAGRRGRKRRIAIVLGAVLVVAAAAALVLVLGSGDDGDDEKAEPEPTSATTDAPTDEPSDSPTGSPADTSEPDPGDPEVIVRRFVNAALAGDCDTAESYMTPYLIRREGGCRAEDLGGANGDIDARIGEASIEPGAASVPVTLIVQEGTSAGDELTYDVRLVVVDDAWKIDDIGRSGDVQ